MCTKHEDHKRIEKIYYYDMNVFIDDSMIVIQQALFKTVVPFCKQMDPEFLRRECQPIITARVRSTTGR